MSYIKDEFLDSEEEIVFSVNKSWFHYLPRIIPTYLLLLVILTGIMINPGSLLTEMNQMIGVSILIGIFILSTIAFTIQHRSEEYVVTRERVVTKEGIFSNDIYEIQKTNIESIDIDQGILGRMFSYGRIEINGTGDEDRQIINIAKPVDFRKAIS